ncbi:hypothetical protein BCF44_13663 [Kutzneria buriramensis]|uniref:Uncharacterized protein n=1 Tax=Kutzneria buriramensis TaxID=1045776 RepID=A0A3E0G6T0_9PSEU|nr:hypothetical protein BCF44_13663 [Kutzneria buriramensis]
MTLTPELLRAVRADQAVVLVVAEFGFTVLPKTAVDEHLVVPLAELAVDEVAIGDEQRRHRLPAPGVETVVVDGPSWAQAWWIPRAELRQLTVAEAPVSVWATSSGRYLRRHPSRVDAVGHGRWSVLEQRAAAELLYAAESAHVVDDGSRLVAAVHAARAVATTVTAPVDGDAAGEEEAFAALATLTELLNQTVTADLRRQRAGIAARVADRHDGDLAVVTQALGVRRPLSQWTLKDLLKGRSR